MLDLNAYMNNYEVVQFGKVSVHVLEPNLRMLEEISGIEENLTEDNIHEKRAEVALIMLNHNKENRVFKEEDIMKLPLEAIVALISKISSMRLKAEKDPN